MKSNLAAEPLAAHDPLADAYRHAIATRRADAGAAGCPEPAALVRLAAGAVEARERESLVDHLAMCVDCAEEWRTARALAPWAADAAPARRRGGWLRAVPAPRLAWAAVALLAVGGAWLLRPTPAWRGDDAPRALPAAGHDHVLAPLHGARLAEVPAELAWRRPVAARVELYDAALVPLGDSGAAVSSPWRLPEPLKRTLRRRGGRIHWRLVTAGEVGPEPSALAAFELPVAP